MKQNQINLKTEKGRGRPPPSWLISLPKGKYTVFELEGRFDRDRDSIRKVLKKHGVEIEYSKENGKIIAYYLWDGF